LLPDRFYAGSTSYCKDCHKAHGKEYYALNKERVLLNVKAYNLKFREVKKAYYSEYNRRTHKALEHHRQRRARIRGNGFAPYRRIDIYERDKRTCGICGNKVRWIDLHIDHIIPIGLGGPDTPENVRAAHSWCNLKRGMPRVEEAK
jgi:hypothetical protein